MFRPKFKDCYHVEVLEPDTVFLLTETTYNVLTSRIHKSLVPLLDGQRTLSDLITLLDGKVSPPELFYALNQLTKAGYLAEYDGTLSSEEAAFWYLLGIDAQSVQQRLHQTSVSVKALGKADAGPLHTALEGLGIPIAEAGSRLDIVVTDDYLQEGLEAINRHALAAAQPWMLVKLIGNVLWIGPIFEPSESGCWACMAQRIRGNRQIEVYIQKKLNYSAPIRTSLSALDSTVQLAANLAATEIAKWLVDDPQSLRGQLLTFDVASAETRKHVLVRRPQCAACGDPERHAAARQPQPIVLTSSKKRYTVEAGHRVMFPEETFARYQHHISPITGVVSGLTDITGEINGILYSYVAGHNFALPRDDMQILRQNMRGRSGGKGATDIQAKVSAISEAMERYSGVYRGEDEITLRGSYQSLAPKAIHLHDCLLFSEKQYANRRTWNQQNTSHFHIVPNPFDEEKELDWTPLWSLTNNEFKYVPTVYCYYGHPDLQWFYCGSDANGCAAGNTLEEAILQGFLELVERDAVALWWYNCIKRPAIDVDSFDLPYFNLLRPHYQKLQRSLWLLDLTTDLGIPVVAAISGRIDREVEDIIIGFGAHLDPKIAVLRALTELNQFLPNVSASLPDGRTKYPEFDQETITWFKTATMQKQSYLMPDDKLASKVFSDYALLHTDDLKDDVQTCVAIAQRAGLETLVLDQTLPDVGMRVCRVIVPGLRHFWRRLGPGRLYEVPVKLGWLEKPLAEEDLNPFSLFF